MSNPNPEVKYVVVQLPAWHEIDEELHTELAVVRGVLGQGRRLQRLKAIPISAAPKGKRDELYDRFGQETFPNARFVHLAGHAGLKGLKPIRGRLAWEEVPDLLRLCLPKLKPHQKRTLCLSCCCARAGLDRMRARLRGRFTQCYYLDQEETDFDAALAMWPLFYYLKEKPSRKVLPVINDALKSAGIPRMLSVAAI